MSVLKRLGLLIFILFILGFSNLSYAEYLVKTIYFQPTDAPEPDIELYQDMMLQIQEYYREDMIEDGYGNKTFNLELNNEGKVKIHVVRGKHNSAHYNRIGFRGTFGVLDQELPWHLNSEKNWNAQDNIHVTIFAGIINLDGVYGMGGPYYRGRSGGDAVINANLLPQRGYETFLYVVAHELLHGLGFWHNNLKGSFLGSWSINEDKGNLTENETRRLNKHHFFNDKVTLNKPPEILVELEPEAMNSNVFPRDRIIFKIIVLGSVNLYHSQLMEGSNLLAYEQLESKQDLIEFKVARSQVHNGMKLWCSVIDINGNTNLYYLKHTTIPKRKVEVVVKDNTNKNENININKNENLNEKEDEVCEHCINKIESNETDLSVYPKSFQLTTKWAAIKK
ncbi:MAG: hypothetical protein OXU23_23550 [Candidatus Poribacteria bacterium]|nr:hypothetical protein [Candidatus Poribacteria bacterium]